MGNELQGTWKAYVTYLDNTLVNNVPAPWNLNGVGTFTLSNGTSGSNFKVWQDGKMVNIVFASVQLAVDATCSLTGQLSINIPPNEWNYDLIVEGQINSATKGSIEGVFYRVASYMPGERFDPFGRLSMIKMP